MDAMTIGTSVIALCAVLGLYIQFRRESKASAKELREELEGRVTDEELVEAKKAFDQEIKKLEDSINRKASLGEHERVKKEFEGIKNKFEEAFEMIRKAAEDMRVGRAELDAKFAGLHALLAQDYASKAELQKVEKEVDKLRDTFDRRIDNIRDGGTTHHE
jgi:Zn-dependent M32 family carboxypeptidase